ncbi:MAG: ABC transporter permease [Actinomycetota bacterium]
MAAPAAADATPVGPAVPAARPRRRHRALRRLAVRGPQYLLIVLVAASANFALPRMMPGNPVDLLLGEDANRLPPETIADELARVGLDQPLVVQYGRYMAGLARGELGCSFRHRKPVSTLLRERLPWTLLLVGTALVVSTVLGVALAALAAWRRGRRRDTGSIALFTFLESTPPFWIGLLLLIWFAATLRWFPLFGHMSLDRTTGLARVGDIAHHLVLPAATLVLSSVGAVFLLARASLLGVIRDDYVLVARAKGLRERTIAVRHALPAASLPIATSVLLRVGALAGGAVIIERVFTYRGVGSLLLEASFGRDYPLLQGGLFVLTVIVVGANLVGDLIYPRLDPRVQR